jgi:hypothetical protein
LWLAGDVADDAFDFDPLAKQLTGGQAGSSDGPGFRQGGRADYAQACIANDGRKQAGTDTAIEGHDLSRLGVEVGVVVKDQDSDGVVDKDPIQARDREGDHAAQGDGQGGSSGVNDSEVKDLLGVGQHAAGGLVKFSCLNRGMED